MVYIIAERAERSVFFYAAYLPPKSTRNTLLCAGCWCFRGLSDQKPGPPMLPPPLPLASVPSPAVVQVNATGSLAVVPV